MSADMGKRQSHVFFSFLSLHREEGGKKSHLLLRRWDIEREKKILPIAALIEGKISLSLTHTHSLRLRRKRKEEKGERFSRIHLFLREKGRETARLDKIWISKTLPLLACCMMVCTIVHVRWGGEKKKKNGKMSLSSLFSLSSFSTMTMLLQVTLFCHRSKGREKFADNRHSKLIFWKRYFPAFVFWMRQENDVFYVKICYVWGILSLVHKKTTIPPRIKRAHKTRRRGEEDEWEGIKRRPFSPPIEKPTLLAHWVRKLPPSRVGIRFQRAQI